MIAVVGLSASWYRPSYFAAKYMQDHGYRVIPVDGISISRRHGLGRIVNSALLGALAVAAAVAAAHGVLKFSLPASAAALSNC